MPWYIASNCGGCKSALVLLGIFDDNIFGILLSAAPHIERLQKPASFFQILLKPAFGH
jgi:hypothetical protein